MPPARPLSENPIPPSPTLLRKLELASMEVAARLLDMPREGTHPKVVKLTEQQQKRLQEIEFDAIANFHGDFSQLEAALGMLRLGYYVGWKVLYLVHSKKTVRAYEDILGIEVRDVFEDERGPISHRSFGLALADKFPNFWKVAGGDVKIPKRRDTLDGEMKGT